MAIWQLDSLYPHMKESGYTKNSQYPHIPASNSSNSKRSSPNACQRMERTGQGAVVCVTTGLARQNALRIFMSRRSRVARNAIAARLIEKREWKTLTSTCLLKPSSDLLHLYQYRKSKRQIEFMDQWKINQFTLEKPKQHSSYLNCLFCFHISHCTQHFTKQ